MYVYIGTMCRDTLSVNWDGQIFDCDFNQQLGLGLGNMFIYMYIYVYIHIHV
jgi:hypothetical protein